MRMGVNVGGTNEAITQSEEQARFETAMTTEQRAERDNAIKRAKQARDWDNLHNEGGEGYNPYRNEPVTIDRTPYQKGDDSAE